MKYYVVSVPRNGRLENIEKQETVLGESIIRINSFDKKLIPEGTLSHEEGYWGCPISLGEKCCYHGHLMALKQIVDSGDSYGVVFEDDFNILDVNKLKNCLEKIPKELDHLQLHRIEFVREWTKVDSEYYNEDFDFCNETSLLQPAYVISSSLAAYILKEEGINKIPYDHLHIQISRDTSFNYFEVKESVVETVNLASIINE
jgi:GR25 family glycosyltransferase involved in LPS biosynthesis